MAILQNLYRLNILIRTKIDGGSTGKFANRLFHYELNTLLL